MLDCSIAKCKNYLSHYFDYSLSLNRRKGFSTAEMLLVLLIVSILIIAMPPLVHKKYQKKVTRGEHGRYECWRDKDTNEVFEYVATEKLGPLDPAMIDNSGSSKKPKGKNLGTNGVCSFNPKQYAPNAAFFSLQVIGGGAGGTYPPYDPSNTQYYDPNHKESFPVQLTPVCWSVVADRCISESIADTGKYSYYAYLNYYNSFEATKWVKSYFPPVLNDSSLLICSGHGHRGLPYLSGAGNSLNVDWGGIGGKGVCYKANSGELALGVNSGDYFQANAEATTKKPSSYLILHSDNQYNWKSVGNALPLKDSRPTDTINMPQTDVRTLEESAHNVQSICYNSYFINYDSSTGNISLTSDSISLSELFGKSCNAALGRPDVSVNVQKYAPSNSSAINGTVQIGCTVQGGEPGLDSVAVTDASGNTSVTKNANTVAINGTSDCATGTWSLAGLNSTDNQYSSPANPQTIFPAKIVMNYTYTYDVPTYGYAGKSGGSASIVLPTFVGNLEIGLGSGGAAGTRSVRKGSSGGNTVVWAKDKTETSTCVVDDSSTRPASCRRILTAKGGMGVNSGAVGPKLSMIGGNTCQYKGDAVKGKLHGCLDSGVATYGEANLRFATDSGFTTIPEFDRRTKTPSAISATYDGANSFNPGSGGDGGYSFIIDNSGTEALSTGEGTNYIHNNLSVESLAAIGHPGWSNIGSYTFSRYSALESSLSSEIASYQCFLRDDDAVGTGGNGADVMEAYPGSNSKVCKPKSGSPGAVVIVW